MCCCACERGDYGMKQNITIEQWDELDGVEKFKFAEGCESFKPWYWEDGTLMGEPPNIGQMIEFLDKETKYQLHLFRRILDWKIESSGDDYRFKKTELCDALWEAVKFKLRN